MIVVGIIALVSAIAYPSLSASLAEGRLADGATDTMSAMQFARFQALLRGRAQVVEFRTNIALDAPTASDPWVVRVRESLSQACNNVAGGATRRVFMPKSVRLTTVLPADVEGSGICFKPDGKVYEAASATPISMDGDEQAQFNQGRAGNLGVRFRRYERVGNNAIEVGVRKEVVLSHLGIARLNPELAANVE